MIGTVVRGVRNPFRSGARAALLVGLLALLLGAFALLMQATEAMQGQVQQLQRTLGKPARPLSSSTPRVFQ